MSLVYRWFGPVYDALFCPSLSFGIRWRLLAFQPLVFLTNTIQSFRGTTLFSEQPHTVIWIPLKRSPGHSVRAIVYHPFEKNSRSRSKPLHLNIHGGGFIGGLPESNAPFCRKLANETGALVVSTSHRYAPRYTFPSAHEDVQDVAEWLIQNAEKVWGADPRVMSVSGFSAGGNLALGAAQWLSRSEFAVKASVTFDAPVDLRLPPWEKPKPINFPAKDPLAFILPLMDAYAGPEREKYRDSPLLHPILADIESLPRNILFFGAKVDILLHEQLVFIDRIKEEAAAFNRKIRPSNGSQGNAIDEAYHIECEFFEDQFHGWLEIPSIFIDANLRDRVYDDAVRFLNTVYTSHG
ncbi:hypothetical protein N7474_004929 [Penicillium riverlandense]|uniref:uncharacterized protein n=1 Tax=Penicillium riverlandense TaxID=1903569 RepID=UPI002546BA1B|nr:uncharacterized protein N7474_004929 [Penicillium riverlandense]KAJ5819338.1 hypothetical protein N7474_004929 [Penicillium riverlandense]